MKTAVSRTMGGVEALAAAAAARASSIIGDCGRAAGEYG